jgi:hypothetical protein
MTWKKEYWLVVVIIICLALLAYRQHLNNKEVTEWISLLPTLGGVFFGLNTLIQIAK